MRLTFLFLFFSAVFYSSELKAQSDSTFTDTVVIFKDPHIIRHKVVIRSALEPDRKIPSMKFGVYFGVGDNKIKSNEPLIAVKGTSFQNAGIQIGCNLNRIELQTGLGILNTSITYNIQKSFETIRTQTETIILVQGSISTVDSLGVLTIVTTTKYGEVTREIKEKTKYNETYTYKNQFIQIPIFIGYGFKLAHQKLKITPGFQLILNKTQNETESSEFRLKNTFWIYGCHLKFEYAIKDYLSVELKGFWQQSKDSIYKNGQSEIWKLPGINFGINYFIGNY